MESKDITIADAADALAPVAEKNPEYADCMLKASRLYGSLDRTILNAAVEIAVGRVRVQSFLPELAKGFFTKKGLQQRTHPKVAGYHASLFTGCSNVLEIGSGLGFDTVALAARAGHVTALEKDPYTAFCAAKNLNILGCSNASIQTTSFDAFLNQDPERLLHFDGIWADPDRRKDGVRTRDAELYDPPLGTLLSLSPAARCAIKIAPGTDPGELPPGWCSAWIAFDGECKERILVRSPDTPADCVVSIDDAYSWSPSQEGSYHRARIPEQGSWYLYEPHPALTVSGYVDAAYSELGIARWDDSVLYGFSASHLSVMPLVTKFVIQESLPYDIKKLSARLAALRWDTRTEIKKRAFPEEPEVIRKKLKLTPYTANETDKGVVFLTAVGKKLIALLGKRVN